MAIENSPNSVVITDDSFQIEYANKTFQTLAGVDKERLVGKNIDLIRKPGTYTEENSREILSQLKNGERVVRVFHNTNSSGKDYFVKSIISPFVSEKKMFALFIEENVSIKYNLKEELLTAKLSEKNYQKSKKEFISLISHEVRTPLNAIMGLSTFLASKEDTNSKTKAHFDSIIESTQRLKKTMDSILNYSDINFGKNVLKERSFDIRYELLSLIREYQLLCHNKQSLSIHFDPTTPIAFFGDVSRLKQTLEILLDNALKFTPEGRIDVALDVLSQKNNDLELQITVIDTGIGIPEDKQNEIFDIFVQADSVYTRKFEGLGVGLSIAEKLVKMLQGEIIVLPHETQGSCFVFTVIMKEGNLSSYDSQVKIKSATSIEGLNILVVEDNLQSQKIIKRMIEKGDAIVDFANHGRQALSMILEKKYDLVLMDLEMPVMNGQETTIKIRSDPKWISVKSIPIIALTVSKNRACIKNCLEIGMDDYVVKPAKKTVLYDLLQHYGNSR